MLQNNFKYQYISGYEQPWPSGNVLVSDKHDAEFEVHHRPMVTSGSASGPKYSCQK